jgi:hypothetical protein
MLKRYPISPILLSAYFVLALAAYNIQQISVYDILRPLVLFILFGIILYVLAYAFLRDWHRAALVADLLIFLFALYGRIYYLGKNVTLIGFQLFRHRTLAPFWLILAIVGVWFLVRKISRPADLTRWINLIACFLLIFPVLTISYVSISNILAQNKSLAIENNVNLPAGSTHPNIYYIILDAYGREDILKQLGYDNSGFIKELEKRGFYVPACAQSNYAYTIFSLSSSLNYEYINDFVTNDRYELVPFVRHNRVRSFLEQQGYETIAVATGFQWTEWKDAGKYFPVTSTLGLISGFESMFLDTTLVKLPLDLVGSDAGTGDDMRRAIILSALKNLKHASSIPGPKFVFAHLVIPHGSYVFGPNGEPVNAEGVKGYLDQVTFINREILDVIDTIQSSSKTPPVIIIQGDHGPREFLDKNEDKLKILNAYYLPDVAPSVVYPSITPVNTFRMVLNNYFSQNLNMLDDKSYFSEDETIKFEQVPNNCSK